MKLIPLSSNREIKWILQLAFVLWLTEILLILLTWRFLPKEVPLFYSHPWGQEQLVKPMMLFIIPGLGLVVFLINSFISTLTPKEERLMKQILATVFLAFNFLSLVTLIQIVRLAI